MACWLTAGTRKVTGVIEGGATRPESTRRAIAALGPGEADVLFHDAARPLLDQPTIAGCLRALRDHRAVGVAVPPSDTIVGGQDGIMTSMPPGSAGRCQTPQGFRLSVIRRAYGWPTGGSRLRRRPPPTTAAWCMRYLPEVPVA